jgi:hypothetical protein
MSNLNMQLKFLSFLKGKKLKFDDHGKAQQGIIVGLLWTPKHLSD